MDLGFLEGSLFTERVIQEREGLSLEVQWVTDLHRKCIYNINVVWDIASGALFFNILTPPQTQCYI